MSAVVYSKWKLRPGGDRVALGTKALEMTRYQRSQEGCVSSRYFWADANSVVLLTELDAPSRVFSGGPTADGSRIAFDFADLADREAWEVWMGAREGTATNKMAGR